MSESPLRPNKPHPGRDIQAEIRRSIENNFSRLRKHKEGLTFFLKDIRHGGPNSLTPEMITWLRSSSNNYRNLFKENRDSASGEPKPSNMEKLDRADFLLTDEFETEIRHLRDEIYAICASASPQDEQVRGLAQEVLEILKIEGEEVPQVASPLVADPIAAKPVDVVVEPARSDVQSPEIKVEGSDETLQNPSQEDAAQVDVIVPEAGGVEEENAPPAWTSGEMISGLEFVSSNGDIIFQVSRDVASYSTLVKDAFFGMSDVLLPDETVHKLEGFLDAVHEQGAPLLAGDWGGEVVDNVEMVLLENERRREGNGRVSAVQQVANQDAVKDADTPIQPVAAEPLVAVVPALITEAEPSPSPQKNTLFEEGFLNASREVDFTSMSNDDVQRTLESVPFIDGGKGISPKLYALLVAIAEHRDDFDEAFYETSRSRELLGEVSVFSKMVADNYSQELQKGLADNREIGQLTKNLYEATRKIEERLLEAARWEEAEDDVTSEIRATLMEQQETSGTLTHQTAAEGALGALPFQGVKGEGGFQDIRPTFSNTQPVFMDKQPTLSGASSSSLVPVTNSGQGGDISLGQPSSEPPQGPGMVVPGYQQVAVENSQEWGTVTKIATLFRELFSKDARTVVDADVDVLEKSIHELLSGPRQPLIIKMLCADVELVREASRYHSTLENIHKEEKEKGHFAKANTISDLMGELQLFLSGIFPPLHIRTPEGASSVPEENPLLGYAVQSHEETQLLPLEVSEQGTVEWARERVHTLASMGDDLIFDKNTLTDIEKINELLVEAEGNGNEAVTLLRQDTFFKENLLHLREMVEKRLRDLKATLSSGILSGEARENAEVIKKSLNFLCKFFGLENEVPAETVQAILVEGGDSEIQVISKPSEALPVITQAGQVVEGKKETPVLFFDVLGKIGSNQEITAEDREIAFNALSDMRSSPENYYQIFQDQATFSKLERYLSENEARYVEEKKKYDSNDPSVDRDGRDFFYFYTSLSDIYKEFLIIKEMVEEGLAKASEQSPAETPHLHISSLGEGRFVPPATETLRVKGGRMLRGAKAWAAARIPGIQKALTLKQETKVTLSGAIASVKESVSMVRDPSIVKKMIQESRKDLEEAVTMAEVNESDILSGAAPFRLRPEGEQNPEATKARATLLEKFKKGVVWYDKLPKPAKYSASVALIGLGIAGTVTGAPVIAGAAVAGRVVLRAASAASLGMGTAAAMRAQNKEGNTFSKFAHNNAAAIGTTAGLVAFFAGNYSEFMRWNLLDIAPHLPQPEISLSVPVSEIPALSQISIPDVFTYVPVELGNTAVGILSDMTNGGLQSVLGGEFGAFQELSSEAKKKFIENLLANLPKDSIKDLGVASGDFTRMVPGQDNFRFDKLAEIAKNTFISADNESKSLIERAFKVANR